jgi:hypothetical protein
MKNILDIINKYAIYIMMSITLAAGCNSCRYNKETVKLRKEVDSLNTNVRELKGYIYDKDELDTRMSIEGYEISKRMLYDQNAIVRTIVRPDDRINEYDKKINELQEKLRKSK